MEKITVKNLPSQKLSDVILSVVPEIERVQKFGYTIDMDDWIWSDEDVSVCSVCLGGAAIMGFVPDGRIKNRYSSLAHLIEEGVNEGITEQEQEMLNELARMFNELRYGSIQNALVLWNQIAADPVEVSNEYDVALKIKDAIGREYIGVDGDILGFYWYVRGDELERLIDYVKAVSKAFKDLGY